LGYHLWGRHRFSYRNRIASLDDDCVAAMRSVKVRTTLSEGIVTPLLQKAFQETSQCSREEQDVIAARLLAELAAENAFYQAIAASTAKLATLARQAIDEHRAGHTEELDPDRL
jgi:hypothetical protein